MLFIKLKLLLKTGASSLSRRLSLQDMERNAFSFKPRHLPFPVHRLFKAKNGALLLFCRGAFPFPYTDSSRQRTERFCFFAEAPSLSRTQTLQGKERSAFAFLPRRLPFPVHRLFKAKNGALLLFCRGAPFFALKSH